MTNTPVLLFARIRELVGSDRIQVPLPNHAIVGELRELITRLRPELAELVARSAVAVNGDYADDARPITPGDEIALIPPVSGG
jgi:molybdopterin converting factor subunit 1